jgi:hypothetical protein
MTKGYAMMNLLIVIGAPPDQPCLFVSLAGRHGSLPVGVDAKF